MVRLNNAIVYIAPSTYTGFADYYMDGTDDHEEINTARAYLSSAFGGGKIFILRGTANITSSITLATNIALEGEGQSTILNRATSGFTMITATGSAGNILQGVRVDNLKFDSTDRENKVYLQFDYCNNSMVRGCHFEKNGILATVRFNKCDSSGIINNSFLDAWYGVYLSGSKCIVDGNNIDGNSTTSSAAVCGISAQDAGADCIIANNIVRNIRGASDVYGIAASITRTQVTNNKVTDCISYTTANTCTGVLIAGPTILAANNYITNNDNAALGTNGRGMWFTAAASNCTAIGNLMKDQSGRGILVTTGATQVMMVGNYCLNNGSDTGIANTNAHNYANGGTSSMTTGNSWQ